MNIFNAGDDILAAEVNENFDKLNKFASIKLSGETINGATTPVPIFIDGGINGYKKDISYETYDVDDRTINVGRPLCQTFTTTSKLKLKKILLYAKASANECDKNITLNIYTVDEANKPTGSSLGSAVIANSSEVIGTSLSWVAWTFTNPITLADATKYAIVATYQSGGIRGMNWASKDTGDYSGGEAFYSDDGTTWTGITDDFNFMLFGFNYNYDGRVFACDANDLARVRFNGFAITDGTSGNDITIQGSGIVSGFTGLTPGRNYYVQDTIGTIGLTPGTYSVLVGVAISATEILIDKRKTKGGASSISLPTTNAIAPFDGYIEVIARSYNLDQYTLVLTINGSARQVYHGVIPVNAGDMYSVATYVGSASAVYIAET